MPFDFDFDVFEEHFINEHYIVEEIYSLKDSVIKETIDDMRRIVEHLPTLHKYLVELNAELDIFDSSDTSDEFKTHIAQIFKKTTLKIYAIYDLLFSKTNRSILIRHLFRAFASMSVESCILICPNLIVRAAEKCREFMSENHKDILTDLSVWEARFNYIQEQRKIINIKN